MCGSGLTASMAGDRSTSNPTLYLIDGSAYLYRAYHALPPLSNSKGIPTNAVYGFTTMVMKILREHRPQYLAVVFDERGPTIRHEAYVEYKANRPEMPEGMQAQIPYVNRIVEAMGLPLIRLAGYEADDLIGTLARRAEGEGLETVIVTGDKDMYQLLSPSARIYDPVKDRWIGEDECRARFGVEPAQVVDVMGLMGDPIDNIPGVRGIGEKTAIKLIGQYGSIEEVLRRLNELPPKTRGLLAGQEEQARLSRSLAVIKTDCPVDFDEQRFAVKAPPTEPLVSLLQELEFSTLLKTLQPAAEPDTAQGPDVEILRTEQDGARVVGALPLEGTVGLAVALSGGVRGDLAGVALASASGRPAYFPAGAGRLLDTLTPLLAQPGRQKVVHDFKAALLALRRRGLDLVLPVFDTMIASYLLSPNRRSHELDALALELLTHRLMAPARPKGDLLDQDDTAHAATAADCAVVVRRLVPILRTRLEEQGMLRLFEDLEMPLVPVLAEIEGNGFLLDTKALEAVSKELEGALDRIMERIRRLAGQEFNINSPKQLAAVLFDKLGLKPVRKTKTGYSTDEDTLTQLAVQHELPAEILHYRSLSKLKSTYVDALPQLVDRGTGRLHTSLNQTVAATGRLSSTDPNLQNIPVKGEYGLRIREAFVAPPGHSLLCADYSQIEPRILAHFSQDETLLRVFERREDIHTATAVQIFNLAADHVTRDMRRIAKTVVFGIIYGISPYGLSQTLGISQTDAKKYIDAYFERHVGVKRFLERTIEEARERGYTTTILGRRRPIPELRSPDPGQRGFGERMAVNSPIQGSAADLIKMAMIAVSRRLREESPTAKMILQVHDELIFEVPTQDLEGVKRLVKAEMEHTGVTLGLSLPLKVDIGVGPNWRAAHP